MNQNIKRAWDEVAELSKSIVIKHTPTIEAMSKQHSLIPGAGFQKDRPDTWRFYRHIQGLYHEHDEPLFVSSMDTQERIEFTKENLKEHKATRIAYQVGSSYYYELKRRHPELEIYINGVLDPIDFDTAYNAEEGTILSYSERWVAPNEVSLMSDVENWIKRFIGRWENTDLSLIYNLYAAGCLINLYSKLPFVIFYYRMKRLNSYEVSGFDLEQTFASNLHLDRYARFLSLDQQLWLYNNLDRLKAGIGTTAVFEELIIEIMERRGLPIAGYRLETDDRELDTKDSEYLALRQKLNFKRQSGENLYISLGFLIDKEEQAAPGNALIAERTELDMRENLKRNRLRELPTKIVETQANDIANMASNTLSSVIHNQWKYLSNNGLYRSVFSVINPINNEAVTFSTKEAFILYCYTGNRLLRRKNQSFESALVQAALRPDPPNKAELRSYCSGRFDFESEFDMMIEKFPAVTSMINAYDFFDYCNSVLEYDRMCDVLKDNVEHYEARAELESVFSKLWVDQVVEYNVEDFDQWLIDRNFDITMLQYEPLKYFHERFYEQCTGYVADSENNVTSIQNALVGIMEEFTSYSIQYLKSSTGSDITLAAPITIRAGDYKARGKSKLAIENVRLEIQNQHNPIVNKSYIDVADTAALQDQRIVADLNKIDIDVDISVLEGVSKFVTRVEMPILEFNEVK